jgi:hypothetical protein
MNVLKNTHPLIIIPLIHKLPIGSLFYPWIKIDLESSKYIGYFGCLGVWMCGALSGLRLILMSAPDRVKLSGSIV